jgi:hypothetical protein
MDIYNCNCCRHNNIMVVCCYFNYAQQYNNNTCKSHEICMLSIEIQSFWLQNNSARDMSAQFCISSIKYKHFRSISVKKFFKIRADLVWDRNVLFACYLSQSNVIPQLFLAHDSTLSFDPIQYCPYGDGEGFEHDLVWVLIPPPQVTLHELHDVQSLQPPSVKYFSDL